MIKEGVICHAEGPRCLGCDHYHGRAPVCVYAPRPEQQVAPTPRTDEYERSIRKPHPVYGLVRPGEKNPMGRFLDLIRSVEADAKEWKEQHENLLAMFRTSEDRAAKAERELSAAKDEAERLREALEKIAEVCNGYGDEAGWACKTARAALAATRKDTA